MNFPGGGKEGRTTIFIFFSKKVKHIFPKKLGLDARITSWDPKNRIPREKVPL